MSARNKAGAQARRSFAATTLLGLLVAAAAGDDRVARLNARFLAHLDTFALDRPLAVETVRAGWRELYDGKAAGEFVPDALLVLFPAFSEALRAFDADRPSEAASALEPLTRHADPYLASNATYFHLRAMVDLGLLEEVEQSLAPLLADSQRRAALLDHTPYAPHLEFILAFCRSSNLRADEALDGLTQLEREYPDAPEPVRVGAQQLRLELERREPGALPRVLDLMNYSSLRLRVADAGDRVRQRQDEVIDLLDQLIQEAEQREQNQGGGGKRASGGQDGQGGQRPEGLPVNPRERSEVDPGEGRIGDLHGAPRANPGDMWGRLPPAERERILQSLRDRFPSRYRQLVEQYYRSLAEQK